MPLETLDRIILAADVGGTNLNLALIRRRQEKFEICQKWNGSTQNATSLLEPARHFLEECARSGLGKPIMACISGAGPVVDFRIPLTNAPWDIEGAALEAGLGIPVHLLNDFTAGSHGVLLLDPADQQQLLPLPHPGGALPTPNPKGTALIVGAGTGLGVGYVTRSTGYPHAFPSEGGHIALPIMDDRTIELWRYLKASLPGPPDAETAVSGPGIAAIFGFLLHTGRAPRSPLTDSLLALPGPMLPPAIAANADLDQACGLAMDLFVDLYARVCADLCAVFLPTGGLYLAGGIAAKNASRFLNGDRFMQAFERNCREHINLVTRSTPVFIVRDYGISLYGAAHAGCLMSQFPS